MGALIALAALSLTCTAQQAVTWPDVAALATRRPTSTAFIDRYRRRQLEAGREPAVQWSWVPYGQISPYLKQAVVVAEDIEFFSHNGFSINELRVVVDRFFSEGELRGASTITQQLAKNLWLSPSRNPLRKLKEALLTRQLEHELTKNRILEVYLNVVEFGPGIYGAEAAARHYFGTSAASLDGVQAAQLAASLPRPSSWHPGVGSDRYHWYVNEVLGRMEKADFLRRRFGIGPPLPQPDTTALWEDTLVTAGFDSLRIVPLDTVPIDSAPPPDTVATDTSAADTVASDTAAADTTGADTAAADTTGADTAAAVAVSAAPSPSPSPSRCARSSCG